MTVKIIVVCTTAVALLCCWVGNSAADYHDDSDDIISSESDIVTDIFSDSDSDNDSNSSSEGESSSDTVSEGDSVSYSDSEEDWLGTRVDPTLILVIAISRHGGRAPCGTYPTFPYPPDNKEAWPNGKGQLTQRGRRQLHRLGERFRTMYNGFLSPYYYHDDFKVYAHQIDRVMMSAEEVTTGLFPPRGFQVWSSPLGELWQPVPVYPTNLDYADELNPHKSKCPRFIQAQKDSMSEFMDKYMANMTAVLDYLQPYTGLPNDDVTEIITVWETFTVAENHGLELPDWALQVFPEPMYSLMEKVNRAKAVGNDVMIRLFGGEMFQQMIGFMSSKAKGTLKPDRSMFYYSGHDTTIESIKGVLGLASDDMGIVKTGSSLVMELHQDPDTGESTVQVLYIDGGDADLTPTLVDLPNCPYPCTLQQLMSTTKKYYDIKDRNKECQL